MEQSHESPPHGSSPKGGDDSTDAHQPTARKLLSEDQEAEVRELRAQRAETRRTTVPGLEEILYEPMPVLDHGFVRVVDYMGDDAAICQAARVSYGRGTKHVRQDSGPDQLPDAPPAHHALRDVRDQVPREAADLRGAPVDPPPHGQRE